MANAHVQEQNKHRLELNRAQDRKSKAKKGKIKNVSAIVKKGLKGNKLGNGSTILLILFALLIDVIQFFLELFVGVGTIVNVIITIVGTLPVAGGLYFFKNFTVRELRPLFGGSGFEIIPIPLLSALPAFTAVIVVIIIRDRFGSVSSLFSSVKNIVTKR